MSKLPTMPFYVDAYLADTMHLTAEEHGVYLLILFNLWRHNGCLPNDDKKIARMTRLTLNRWRQLKPTIMKFLILKGDQISQKRLSFLWNQSMSKSVAFSLSGTKGARAKALKYHDPPLADASNRPQARLPIGHKPNSSQAQAYQDPNKIRTEQGGDSDLSASSAAPDGASSALGDDSKKHLLETPLMKRTRP